MIGSGCNLDRMSDVTRILGEIEAGDPQAASQLLPLIYDELRKLAAQKMATRPVVLPWASFRPLLTEPPLPSASSFHMPFFQHTDS